MYAAYFIVSSLIAAIIVLVSSVTPSRSGLSTFELSRRRDGGSKDAGYELHRETMIADLYSLRRIIVAVFLVLFVLFSVAGWGPVWGAAVSIILALSYGKLATLSPVHSIAMKLYEENEARLIKFIETHPKLIQLARSVVWVEQQKTLSSREELEYMVKASQGILREHDKKRIVNSLHFDERTVSEVMTPRSVINYVNKNDVIGPLMLNELHITGHSRFPVIENDLDHVVGLLYTKDLVTLSDKQSKTAGEVMDSRVYYINADQTLNHALTAFLKARHHMFIVVNEYRETAGVVTLEDVVEAFLGYKIIDEFDQHDDLRVVAERKADKNNNPPDAINV